MNKSINLELPIPPSVNVAFATNFKTGRRFKSKKYGEWERDAKIILDSHNAKYSIVGDEWLSVTYTFFMPIMCKNGNKKIKDVANYEKALTDFLCANIEGFQDHKITRMYLQKVDSPVERVVIEIQEEN